MIARYRKAVAALLGAATPAVVMAILGLVGEHINAGVAGGICAVLATGAVALAPANATAPPAARTGLDAPETPLVG